MLLSGINIYYEMNITIILMAICHLTQLLFYYIIYCYIIIYNYFSIYLFIYTYIFIYLCLYIIYSYILYINILY